MNRKSILIIILGVLALLQPITGQTATSASGTQGPVSSYILGDTLAYGLHMDGLADKLQEKLGGPSRISYDGGRSITTPGVQIKQTAFESVEADKDFIASAGVIIIVIGMNPQESSFADSQQQLIKKFKSIAPNARYYWVDIGATVSTHVDIWNARNQIIYENAPRLGYSVISRYRAIFGSAADPLNITPGVNFPGWADEPGLNGPGNMHGYYPELTRAILTAVTNPTTETVGLNFVPGGKEKPLKSYVLGDSIAYGLHLDGLAAKLQERLGDTSRISYDGGRSITTPGNQIKQTAFESVIADKDFIASAGVIVIVLGMNPQESSFADSQQLLIRKLKSIAPNARYYWVDIGATASSHVGIWNERNKIIYENSSRLGYSVISRYKAIFGSAADPLNITAGANFPGWANEPGLNGSGNIHGYYPELTRAIVAAASRATPLVAPTVAPLVAESAKPVKTDRAACNNPVPLSTYVLGDSIAYGLHRDRLALKLQAQFGGVARISYDTGRSIATPGNQIKKTALESVDIDKAFIATADLIIVSLGTNQKEESFADSQQQIMQKLKSIAPNAKYYWIDIGATISSQVAAWNIRNRTIYDNAAKLGYTVISRYKAIFGPTADPLNITPGQNFPGWVTEPGYGSPGNVHGAYSELTEMILDVLSESAGCTMPK
ncbi:MAG: SGNH/GDSL hydrolase family protein [Rhodoferax sp.]